MGSYKKGVNVNFTHKKKSGNGFNFSTKKGKIKAVSGNVLTVTSGGKLYEVNKDNATFLGEKTALTKALSSK